MSIRDRIGLARGKEVPLMMQYVDRVTDAANLSASSFTSSTVTSRQRTARLLTVRHRDEHLADPDVRKERGEDIRKHGGRGPE
jgi:hypothetical protein